MNTQIVTGSIADLAQRNQQSIAETFLGCDCIVLIDVSGSMVSVDPGQSNTRYDRAVESLKKLQASLPGKIAVVRFSDEVAFEPSGVPEFSSGGTDLVAGLQFVKIADTVPDMRFVVISDGQPNDESKALDTAKKFQNRIDVIFVGDERNVNAIRFMNKLAASAGGKQISADSAQIAETVQFLLA